MNIDFIVGRIGNVEVKRLENGTAVAKITVATNENFKDKNDEWQTKTTWHNVILWRNLAEKAEKFGQKGNLAIIVGKTDNRKYTDKDGVEKYTSECIADKAEFYETVKKEGQAEAAAPKATTPSIPKTNTVPNTASADSNEEVDGDLPF